jgi:hypothetical protein
MNTKSIAFALATTASLGSIGFGATSAQLYIDKLNTSSGVGNPASGAAWALIYDQNNDSNLPGGLTDGESLVVGDASAIAAAFGQSASISNNTVLANGDRIIMTGTVPLSGIIDEVIIFDIGTGTNQVASARRFALYWFPGLSVGGTFDTTGAYQIGGVFEQNPHVPSSSDYGMIVPTDGESGKFLSLDSQAGFAESRLVAVAIPEPSALTLSGLAALALLRRRRA